VFLILSVQMSIRANFNLVPRLW